MQSISEFINERKQKINSVLKIRMRDIGGKTHRYFYIEKAAFLPCKHLNKKGKEFKIFTFERLKAIKPDKNVLHDIWENESNSKYPNIEYRIGYFIIGKKGKAKDKWWWGQSCPMIGHEDFHKLIEIAYKEEVILKK